MQWKGIETAPKGVMILLGTESDPLVDTHMMFISIGSWENNDGFFDLITEQVIFPSHWAPITSPVKGARPTVYKNGSYYS